MTCGFQHPLFQVPLFFALLVFRLIRTPGRGDFFVYMPLRHVCIMKKVISMMAQSYRIAKQYNMPF